MNKIALVYGPTGGSTEKVAKLITEKFGKDKIDLIPVKEITTEKWLSYDNLICGTATIGDDTWDQTFRKDDWSNFFPELLNLDLKHQTIACFGLGDHITYSAHFVDGLGKLVKILEDRGVKTIGRVDVKDYEFSHSEATDGNQFVGLPVDEDFESDKTNGRVLNWLSLIQPEFNK
ncbi:flavodoxin [Halosquirtibacter xylanolyticus]|uniref:flavodoxin n=1 Tax=Halosquirtibacter xylanolyticus TaxID=3374599 RepID=UPI00374A8DC1|nr:flavodoxin [Prolixibacteraceae bacterium]